MSTDDSIPLKDYFEKLMEADRKALLLQAKEYERRLEGLNHEASQLKKMQSTYLPRETFDIQIFAIKKDIDTLTRLVYIGVGIIIVLEVILKFIR